MGKTPTVCLLPQLQHVSLHGKSVLKYGTCVGGYANNMHPLSLGGGHKRIRSVLSYCYIGLICGQIISSDISWYPRDYFLI